MKVTIHNLDQVRAQDLFNQVAFHMLTQNEKSTDGISMCRYRGIRNLKCAVGILIPDEDYYKEMENKHWLYIPAFNVKGIQQHSHLIVRLQQVHDNCRVCKWKEQLTKVAEDFGLSDDAVKYAPVEILEEVE